MLEMPQWREVVGGVKGEGEYGATIEETGSAEPDRLTVSHEHAALIWSLSADSHMGPRHLTAPSRGRPDGSTRHTRQQARIPLASPGTSTDEPRRHVGHIDAIKSCACPRVTTIVSSRNISKFRLSRQFVKSREISNIVPNCPPRTAIFGFISVFSSLDILTALSEIAYATELLLVAGLPPNISKPGT